MKKYVRLLPLAGLMMVGCAQSAQQETGSTAAGLPASNEVAASGTAGAALASDVPLARLLRVAGHPVIYQGTMELEVVNFAQASAQLDTLLLRRGAYLTTAQETSSEERHEQALTIRVPSRSSCP